MLTPGLIWLISWGGGTSLVYQFARRLALETAPIDHPSGIDISLAHLENMARAILGVYHVAPEQAGQQSQEERNR